VLVAERWIAAALRNRTFYSLAEANAAIAERVAWLNNRPFRKLDGSRASLFRDLDAPALRSLPERPYEYGIWRRAKVSIDYHVELDRHYYSVPYQLVGETADARLSATTVELFVRGRRVASHPRVTNASRPLRTARTCRRAIEPTRSGRRLGSSPGASRPDLRPDAWSPNSWPAVRIPSSAIAAVWASSGSVVAMATAPRGCLRPSTRHRRPDIPQRRLDPAPQPRHRTPA